MTTAIRRHVWLALLLAALVLLLFASLVRGHQGPRVIPPSVPAVEVTAVQPHGPADRAGLEVGDHVLSVDGTRVLSPSELRRLLYDAGESARLMVRRGRTGKEVIVIVYPESGRIGIEARMGEDRERYSF
jgi:C-terminal processing protease CtpA/Prc